jgi:hypothetical protein
MFAILTRQILREGAAGEDTDLRLEIILDGLIVILLLTLDLCITQSSRLEASPR